MASLQNIEAQITSSFASLANSVSSVYESIVNPAAPLRSTFTRLKAPSVQRSSHTVNVVDNKAYIFGGEISPREPVDNAMHVITLPSIDSEECSYEVIAAKAATEGAEGMCDKLLEVL
jgi:hypothetical protein